MAGVSDLMSPYKYLSATNVKARWKYHSQDSSILTDHWSDLSALLTEVCRFSVPSFTAPVFPEHVEAPVVDTVADIAVYPASDMEPADTWDWSAQPPQQQQQQYRAPPPPAATLFETPQGEGWGVSYHTEESHWGICNVKRWKVCGGPVPRPPPPPGAAAHACFTVSATFEYFFNNFFIIFIIFYLFFSSTTDRPKKSWNNTLPLRFWLNFI